MKFRLIYGQPVVYYLLDRSTHAHIMHTIPLNPSVRVETCRAQSLDEDLASQILRVCQESPEVAACNVLDFRKPDTGQTGMFIVLTVDVQHQMQRAAPKFVAMLEQFPPEMHVGKVFVASSQTLDVSRYAAAEFYVGHTRASVQPPVDLDKPVENPALSAALDGFTGSRSPETEQELFRQLRRAVFLVPMLTDEMKMMPSAEPGVGTIEKDSTIKIFACADHLPLFTDWSAIQAWTEQKVATLVLPAAEAWDFVLSQPHYAGAFINPGSQRLQLSREFVQYLKMQTERSNKSPHRCQSRPRTSSLG